MAVCHRVRRDLTSYRFLFFGGDAGEAILGGTMYRIVWCGLFERSGELFTQHLNATSDSEVHSFEIIAGITQAMERQGYRFKSHVELSILKIEEEPSESDE